MPLPSELASQCHPFLNATPADTLTPGSDKKVWWVCGDTNSVTGWLNFAMIQL